MRTETVTTTITGKGDTRERSLADVFRQIPESIRGQVAGTCFRIEPVEVEVTDAIEIRRSEKFLGFLFPRTRVEFQLTTHVVVEVSSLDLAPVQFRVRTEQLSVTQHLLQLR